MPLRSAGKKDGDLEGFLSLTKNATEPLVGDQAFALINLMTSVATGFC